MEEIAGLSESRDLISFCVAGLCGSVKTRKIRHHAAIVDISTVFV